MKLALSGLDWRRSGYLTGLMIPMTYAFDPASGMVLLAGVYYGATLGSFLSYGMEQRLATAEDKKQFGKGSLIGLAAPETGNNAASSGSYIPLLTLIFLASPIVQWLWSLRKQKRLAAAM